MPNTEPITKYLAAVEAQKRGEKGVACTLLAEAMGAEKASNVVNGSVDRLLAQGTLANEVTLEIVANEVSRRKK